MELTRGRGLKPSVMASIEVPYDMKEGRTMKVKGRSPMESVLTTPFAYQGNALLYKDI